MAKLGRYFGASLGIGLAVGFFPASGTFSRLVSTNLGFECRSGLLDGGGSTVNVMGLPSAAAPTGTV